MFVRITRETAVDYLNTDLHNEITHQMFYLYAATAVEGLHREELREFFLKEAHEELEHVHEFSDLLSYFGGKVKYTYQSYTPDTHKPSELIKWAIDLENHVAKNYAERLKQTEPHADDRDIPYDPWIATLHVFYEDQIKNSQTTAWELSKWLTRFSVEVKTE